MKLALIASVLSAVCLCGSQAKGDDIEPLPSEKVVFQIPAEFEKALLEFTGTKSIVEITSAVYVQTHEYRVYGIRVVLEHFADLKRDIAEGVLITDVAYVIMQGTEGRVHYLMAPLSHLLNPNGIDFKKVFQPPIDD